MVSAENTFGRVSGSGSTEGKINLASDTKRDRQAGSWLQRRNDPAVTKSNTQVIGLQPIRDTQAYKRDQKARTNGLPWTFSGHRSVDQTTGAFSGSPIVLIRDWAYLGQEGVRREHRLAVASIG